MEHITMGQVAQALALIVAILTAVTYLEKALKQWISDTLKDKFDGFEKKQAEILKRIDDVDLENCKNYLVTFLAEISRGEPKDETEMQRFWEEFDHYEEKGGNSYVKHRVDELKGKGIL